MIDTAQQARFYSWQLQELESAWAGYANSGMHALFESLRAFKGEVYGLDRRRGNVVLRFPRSHAPRIDAIYALYLYRLEAGGMQLLSWDIKFQDFRTGPFCHYCEESEPVPLYYLDHPDELHHYLGCGNIDTEVFRKFSDDLDKGKRTAVILGEKEPPYQFLRNLLRYVQGENGVGFSIPQNTGGDYPVIPLAGEGLQQRIAEALDRHQQLIIQGPPGTGKSTIVADLVRGYAKAGASVCITALSNKALVEIVSKESIAGDAVSFRILKTSLSASEMHQYPFLEPAGEILPVPQSVLLTTFHRLSALAQAGRAIFDLLVIEEASQAFHTVIEAFSPLASKVVIIGDPMQLPPVVLNQGQAVRIHPDIRWFINGLESLMWRELMPCFLLSESYRLSPYSAGLTGIFYGNRLLGRNTEMPLFELPGQYRACFEADHPQKIKLFNHLGDESDLKPVAAYLKGLLQALSRCNPGLHTAVLTPLKRDVLYFQASLLPALEKGGARTTIETIDRVQGLTVDITILVLRMEGSPSFTFNANRFNVATSRARFYNLIITDSKVKLLAGTMSRQVFSYLDKLPILD